MVQGTSKKSKSNGRPGAAQKSKNAAKYKKVIANEMRAKVGSSTKMPKRGNFKDEAATDKALSKAIDKASEQKVAAKFIQGGGKMSTTDLMQKGKELNKTTRRAQVKKKLTRVEEKLKGLKEKAERDGMI